MKENLWLNLLWRSGLVLMLSSCFLFSADGVFSYDSQNITVQVLNLFNQRNHLDPEKTNSWAGDWVFRRERLAMIDYNLKNIKPDIIIFTEMMEKEGNHYDTDKGILAAGSLFNYHWLSAVSKRHPDGVENEHVAIAVNPSLLDQDEPSPIQTTSENKQFIEESSGTLFLTFQKIENQDTPIAILNTDFQMTIPDQLNQLQKLLGKSQYLIQEKHACANRTIIALQTTIPMNNPEYEELLSRFDLQDSAKSFCKNQSSCFTRTSQNELSLKAIGDQAPEITNRILLSKDVILYDAKRNFEETSPASAYLKRYHLKSLTMSHEYGWKAILRLPGCEQRSM